MRAWQRMFSDYLDKRGVDEPYAESDYFDYIDGKPRYDGVRSFLASRNLNLPDGDPSDPPDAGTVCGLGNRKNEVFAAVLADEGVEPYPAPWPGWTSWPRGATQVAVVSSSRNAPAVLAAAGLADRFDVVVDGRWPPRIRCPASRPRTHSSSRPINSACRPSGPSWSRTPSRGRGRPRR